MKISFLINNFVRITVIVFCISLSYSSSAQEIPQTSNAERQDTKNTPAQLPTPAINSTKDPSPTGKDKNYWEFGSIMFDKKSVEYIHEAIKAYDSKIPIEILLPNLFPSDVKRAAPIEPIAPEMPKGENIPFTPEAPKNVDNFYLKSILYFGKDNWTIWLNDNKISNKDTEPVLNNLKTALITKDSVTFVWENSQINLIYPGWKESFIDIDGIKYASQRKDIVVDSVTGNISFILKPNQTLIPKTLTIIEGNIVDERVANSSANSKNKDSKDIEQKAMEEETKTKSFLPDINPQEALKSLEKLKSILDQNVNKLR